VLFNSAPFAAFFICYFVLHTITPTNYRLGLMIVGSSVFYGYWNWAYAGLPVALTLVGFFLTDFVVGANAAHRSWRLGLSVAVLLIPLVFFKYTNFFWNEFLVPLTRAAGLQTGGRLLDLGLPLGISFLTFTLLAYVIDVGRGAYSRAPLKLLLCYVLFFPHLIAGPILRPRELMPQLRRGMLATQTLLLRGSAVFTLGLVKKMAIADPVGVVVTAIYNQSTRTAVECLYAFYGFAVQIYCDFSGYTDMAIGLALMLGVRLPNNFRQPYCATSIADFWRRWHLTLSHWLRDYVYISMGGNRHGEAKSVRNILVTMILGGLWHGANWTFVIWGFVHGVGVAVNHLISHLAPGRTRLRTAGAIVVTFHLVTLLWVLFRAPTVSVAIAVISGLVGDAALGSPIQFFSSHPYECLLLPVFFSTHRFDNNRWLQVTVLRTKRVYVLGGIAFLLVLTIVLGTGSSAQFIYFDF
jgi:alginate O-acetyltransferase complex protein AlgI